VVSCWKIERRAVAFSAVLYLFAFFIAYWAGYANVWALGKASAPEPLEPKAIFLPNFYVATLLWTGLFLKGIPTLLLLAMNAIIHGFSLGKSNAHPGVLWPYGIFELAALWIASGTGLARPLATIGGSIYPTKCALRWIPVYTMLLLIAAYLEAWRT